MYSHIIDKVTCVFTCIMKEIMLVLEIGFF